MPERAEQAVWLTGFYNTVFLGSIAGFFIFWAEPMVGIFTSDARVLEIGSECLRVIGYGYGFYAWVMVQAFNGAGDTKTPTWINLGCYWMFQIPLAFYLARDLDWGPSGVFWAIAIAEAFYSVVCILVFRRGRWKTRQV